MTTSTPIPDTQAPSADQMWHTTLGDPANPALLLLHGMFSSHLETLHLAPFLKAHFYIILVDLPGHSRSRASSLTNLRLPQITDLLAALIRDVSPTGRAHVAGMSWGGYIGFELARRYPELVDTLFVSGAPPSEGKGSWLASQPWARVLAQGAEVYVPDALFWMVCRSFGVPKHVELRAELKGNFSRQMVRDIHADCVSVTMERVAEIRGVRVCVVAGGLQDNVEAIRRAGITLKESGQEGRKKAKAFCVRRAIHCWDLQFPELFADGITAWVEDRDMPPEYEETL
jgi:pimeloyl-ACP methyl ester carboxylesterase